MRELVERLLASRPYGERWGRHWLDLVRYADTAGDAADFPVPEAYKYRNYVDLTPGGRHQFPHRLTYFYRQHEPFQETYSSNKRSVYLMQQRIQKNPYLDLFDGPDCNLSLDGRDQSATALQALYFMNSQFAHEQSDAIAARVLSQSAETAGRVISAYMTIFGRQPSDADIARATLHLTKVKNDLGQPEPRA